MKKVYCIIVTYNGTPWIEKCLNSILASSYPVHIVVVDNASTDFTTTIIKNSFPGVQLISLPQNIGFGQANNKGLTLALESQADYVFLLNQDAWIEEDSIYTLIKCSEENSTYGIISPIHLNGTGTGVDKYFMEYFLQSDMHDMVTNSLLGMPRQNKLVTTAFVNAAAWLITRECLLRTGGFDPIFFHYGEDRNYIQRAIYWNYKAGISTQARIYHDRETRITKDSVNLDAVLKKEWIHFLSYACDIRQTGYVSLLLRRFLRYSFLLVIALVSFSKTRIRYNYFMAKKIAGSASAIRRSHKISSNATAIPHLPAISGDIQSATTVMANSL